MKRRDFISKSGMAAVGTLLLATPFASILANNNKKKNMRIVVLTGSPRRNGNTKNKEVSCDYTINAESLRPAT